jgi:nucleotide-binding universal stress UspA family protein
MFQKILVASDLTDASLPALRLALSLAVQHKASLTAVHAAEAKTIHFSSLAAGEEEFLAKITEREGEAAKQRLEAQVEKAKAGHFEGAIVEIFLLHGHPTEVIPAHAGTVQADLLVVGTHGRTGHQHALLGSVAERIVRVAPCPVLVVRAK